MRCGARASRLSIPVLAPAASRHHHARSTRTGARGTRRTWTHIVAQIRRRWPRTRILLRADSGFARDALMAWCEMNQVDFVFGLARNARLVEEISVELLQAEAEASSTGKPVRRFKDILGS